MHPDAQAALRVLVEQSDDGFEPAKQLYKLFIRHSVLTRYRPSSIGAEALIAKYEGKLGQYF